METAYPPAPWQLCGAAIQSFRLIDLAAARPLVPRELRVVPVAPGRTLGALYCASYEPPSTLRYHELILAPALVAARGRVGFWISHIYVDDPASQAGGHAIWSLPKALATFDWKADRREVAVRCGSQPLCRIRWRSGAARVPVPVYLPAISRSGSALRFFSGTGSAQVGWRGGTIVLDADSPLPRLGFERARTLFVARNLRLRVAAPRDRSSGI